MTRLHTRRALALLTASLLAPLAFGQASADAGKRQFVRCAGCHAVSAQAAVQAAQPMAGPHLEGIVGRAAGSVEGFAYSEALRDRPFIWDEVQLNEWLQHPHEKVPDMCMPFMGLPREADRKALIEYLKNPAP